MSTTTSLSSAEIRERAAAVECELEAVCAKIPAARRALARAFLGGSDVDEVASLRTQERKLRDVLDGLRLLAAETERRELQCEIDRRKRLYENDGKKLAELQRAGTRWENVIEGSGNDLAIANRRDQEERNAAFERYAEARNAHNALAKAIDELRARRDAIARELPDCYEES